MPERTLKVGDVAKHLGVDPNTVRNWCKWYAPYMSPGANPPSGSARTLTLRDQNILTFVQFAMKEGMNHAELSEELARKTFSNNDVDIIVGLTEIVPTSPQDEQEGRGELILLPLTLSNMREDTNALRAEFRHEITLIQQENGRLRAEWMWWHRLEGAVAGLALASFILVVLYFLVWVC